MNPQQPQQQFYDPSLDGMAQDMTIVLQPVPFKPLYNTKTRNFFSYSYQLAERNASANNESDIVWVSTSDERVPEIIRNKVRLLKKLHFEAKELREEYALAEKDEDRRYMRQVRKMITKKMEEIDVVLIPLDERKYIESKEAERYRLEQQNELKLDAASIAALTGNQNVSGSTADVSIALVKLEEANKKIAQLEADAKANLQDVPQVEPLPVEAEPEPQEEIILPEPFIPEDVAPAPVMEQPVDEKSPWAE